MLTDARLNDLAERLVAVPGVLGVMLGGSRARGAEHPDSDVDLGLYYETPLDLPGLRDLARQVSAARADTEPPDLTELGAWGAWVDGGGWLVIDGMPVDWLYRSADRVRHSIDLALTGTFDFHCQVGHPLGVPDFAYAGEVALGVVLADPTGELGRWQRRLAHYPPPLRDAIVDRLWEARFLLGGVAKSAGRTDTTFVAGCLFRVISLCAHAVHAQAGRWVTHEKGLVNAAGLLPSAPADFSRRAHAILAALGSDPDQLRRAVADASALVEEVSSS